MAREGIGRARLLMWVLIALSPLIVLAVGCLLLPEMFWDGFVYKYFWGPVVADREGGVTNGISEGYNIVNTLVYTVLLAAALYLGYRVARRVGFELDVRFMIASLPFFLFGGVARALEDALLLDGWLQYLLISPLIYLVVGSVFVLSAAVGHLLKKVEGDRRVMYYGLFIVTLLVIYFVATSLWRGQFAFHLSPLLPFAFAVLSISTYRHLAPEYGSVHLAIFSTGLLLLLIAFSFAVGFSVDASWQAHYASASGQAMDLRIHEAIIIPGIALLLTALVIGGRYLSQRLALLATPPNLLMFFSHFLDGSATYRGIELYGYGEKHVLPTALIEMFDTAAIMLLLKFVVVVTLIYLIDIILRSEMDGPLLGNIMKFAVIFLGLSPGTRNMVRIVLGV